MTGSVCILVALSVAQANDWQSSPHAHPSEIRSTASPSEEDGHAGHGHGDTATGPNQPTRANDVLAVPSLPDERGIDRS